MGGQVDDDAVDADIEHATLDLVGHLLRCAGDGAAAAGLGLAACDSYPSSTTVSRQLVFSVAGSRLASAHRCSRARSLPGSSLMSAMMLRWSAYWAASRKVFFSPLPPSITGMWSR